MENTPQKSKEPIPLGHAIVQRENTLAKKGWGLALGLALILLYLYYVPQFLKEIWPHCLQLIKDQGWSELWFFVIGV